VKTRTWVWIVVVGVVVAILGFFALIGAGIFLVVRNVEVEPATSATAEREFEQTAARFAGQSPLIEIGEHGRVRRREVPERPAGPRPQTLKVLAWSADEDRLVRVNIPFWLLRLSGRRGRFNLGSDDLDLDRLRITADDLERHGRGLVLDFQDSRGTRVLIWAE
jgi:hypothetical protein